MNRTTAISAWQSVMDELARLSEELQTINLLIIHFRQRPTVVRKLSMTKRRLEAERDRLIRMQQLLSKEM